MLIASLTPLLGGLILPHLKIKSRKIRTAYVEAVTLLASLLVLRLLKTGSCYVPRVGLKQDQPGQE